MALVDFDQGISDLICYSIESLMIVVSNNEQEHYRRREQVGYILSVAVDGPGCYGQYALEWLHARVCSTRVDFQVKL